MAEEHMRWEAGQSKVRVMTPAEMVALKMTGLRELPTSLQLKISRVEGNLAAVGASLRSRQSIAIIVADWQEWLDDCRKFGFDAIPGDE